MIDASRTLAGSVPPDDARRDARITMLAESGPCRAKDSTLQTAMPKPRPAPGLQGAGRHCCRARGDGSLDAQKSRPDARCARGTTDAHPMHAARNDHHGGPARDGRLWVLAGGTARRRTATPPAMTELAMDGGYLPTSFAWIALGVGYAWSVRKLGRMSRASDVREPDRKLELPVDDVPIRDELRRGA